MERSARMFVEVVILWLGFSRLVPVEHNALQQFRKVKEIGDKQNLQDDIDKLVKWSEKMADVIQFWEM